MMKNTGSRHVLAVLCALAIGNAVIAMELPDAREMRTAMHRAVRARGLHRVVRLRRSRGIGTHVCEFRRRA